MSFETKGETISYWIDHAKSLLHSINEVIQHHYPLQAQNISMDFYDCPIYETIDKNQKKHIIGYINEFWNQKNDKENAKIIDSMLSQLELSVKIIQDFAHYHNFPPDDTFRKYLNVEVDYEMYDTPHYLNSM